MGPPLSIAPVRDGPRQAAEGQSLHFGNWISLCLQLTYIVLRFQKLFKTYALLMIKEGFHIVFDDVQM